MRNVFILLPTDTLAGAELNLKRIASYLYSQGYNVIVIFMSKGDNGTWSDVPVNKIYLKSHRESSSIFSLLVELIKLRFKGFRFDYSFSSHVHCNSFISLARSLSIINIDNQIIRESTNIFSCFSGARLKLFKFLYGFYSLDAMIICQTERMKKELIVNVSRFKSSNIIVLNNPVDYSKVRFMSKRALDNVSRSKEILMVGRLVPEKGYEVALRAFSNLKEKSYILRIIGSGPLLNELKDLATKLGIKERVIFMGFLSNPAPYMRSAQLCLISSHNEGFPNTLLEMMCVSRRVVSTECTDGIKNLPGILSCRAGCSVSLLHTLELSLSMPYNCIKENMKMMRRHVSKLTVSNYVQSIFDREV